MSKTGPKVFRCLQVSSDRQVVDLEIYFRGKKLYLEGSPRDGWAFIEWLQGKGLLEEFPGFPDLTERYAGPWPCPDSLDQRLGREVDGSSG